MGPAHLLLPCLLGLLQGAQAYRAYDLINETNMSETSMLLFQEKMQKLNDLQQQLLLRPNTQSRLIGRRPVAVENRAINVTEDVQSKPDQIPYLFEGDIVLTDSQMDEILRNAEDQLWATVAQRTKRSMTSSLGLRWTFPIPYYISTNTGVSESAVLAGIAKWEEETCATFTRLNNTNYSKNCLNFILGQGCYSYIGKVNSIPQVVSIGYGCTSLGTVTHEIGHALGFYHEQARYDRDSYVSIVTANIQSTYLNQFTKQSKSSMVDYGVGYDLGSVMHYDQNAFSSNGGQSIETVDPNYQMTIGQRIAPSFADVKRINQAYCNATCSTAVDCQNGGYTDPKNCSQCRCPDGFGGTLCERAANAPSTCGPGDVVATDQLQTIQASGDVACPYVITAPEGKKIFFQLGTFIFTQWTPCSIDYLEIKYGSEFVTTGARFCGKIFPVNSLSTTNRLVVIYRGSASSRFSLSYRYDPATPVVTVAPTTVTPTTTPATSTASTTTTTTTQTTTTKKTTTATTTRTPATSTSTTSKATSTTTPARVISTSTVPVSTSPPPKTTTRMPTTPPPTSPTTRRTTRQRTTPRSWGTTAEAESTVGSTEEPRTRPTRVVTPAVTTAATVAPTPTTTTMLPQRPKINTFFPQVQTTPSPKCSAWTSCTALCGGCGTTTRRCGVNLETKHCNLQPCDNGYCCLPFFYVKQGLCVKPYSDQQIIATFMSSLDESIDTVEASGEQPV